jgi:cytochrome c-type biogenesis protein CcmE
MQSRTLKILLTVAVIGGGAAFLMAASLDETVSYYKHVEEVMAAPDQWAGKSMQVHGFVEAGSLDERIEQQTTKRTFVLESKGKRIAVRHEGPKPDTFKELAEVVASGTIANESGEYVLTAHELTAKCPSKYDENQRTRTLTAPTPR